MTGSLPDAWRMWEHVEKDIATASASETRAAFSAACLIGYLEKIALLYPHVEGGISDYGLLVSILARDDVPEGAAVLTLLQRLGVDFTGGLDLAVAFDHPGLVRHLISIGCDPAERQGMPLLLAASHGAAESIGDFLKAKRFSPEVLLAACLAAAREGQRGILETLIDAAPFDIHWRDDLLLCKCAAESDMPEGVIADLLKKGARVQAGGGMPLRNALMAGTAETVRALTDAGADPLLMPEDGWKAAMAALEPAAEYIRKGLATGFVQAEFLFDRGCVVRNRLYLAHLEGTGPTGLMISARCKEMKRVVEDVAPLDLEARRKYISVKTLCEEKHNGICTLDILLRTGQAETLFNPRLWEGRLDEAHALWSKLPREMTAAGASNELMQQCVAFENRLRLKQRAIRFKPRQP